MVSIVASSQEYFRKVYFSNLLGGGLEQELKKKKKVQISIYFLKSVTSG